MHHTLWFDNCIPIVVGGIMPIHVVRLGSERLAGEGLRIGTVRYPPRGIPKSELALRNVYDVWLPELAPSPELLKFGRAISDDREWRTFVRRYGKEMGSADKKHLIRLLAALSHQTSFSVGCYCGDETRCHRSTLRDLLAEQGALVAS